MTDAAPAGERQPARRRRRERPARVGAQGARQARAARPGQRALRRHRRARPAPLWSALRATSACRACWCPRPLGGAGASAREAAAVLEELGRAVAPVAVPHRRASSPRPPLVALGRRRRDPAGAGRPASRPPRCWSAPPVGRRHGSPSGRPLSGRVDRRRRRGLSRPTCCCVPARATPLLYAVRGATGVTRPVASLDMTRPLGRRRPRRVPSGRCVRRRRRGDRRAVCVTGRRACSPPSRSASPRWALETTIGYLKERRQFGRVVGGFQALKHRLADLYAEVEQADAAARYAAATLADRRPRRTGRGRRGRRRSAARSPCTPPRRPSSCTAASA